MATKTVSDTSRRRVAFIGASFLFVGPAVRDMLLNGNFDDTHLVLYDIDREILEIEYNLVCRMIRQKGSAMTVSKARSRKAALEGADYVIVSVLVGGLDVVARENRACRKHGIRHTVGDTIGPMSTARLLRQAPLLVDIARDMQKYCPRAVMLSPTNPMTGTITAVERYTETRSVGVCHGTSHLQRLIAASYGVERKDVELNVVGVNHLGFVDSVIVQGRPETLRDVLDRTQGHLLAGGEDSAGQSDSYQHTFEYARRIGFLPNNGDHHFLEFFRWFLAPDAFDAEGRSRFGVEHRLLDVPQRKRSRRKRARMLQAQIDSSEPLPNMDSYGGEYIQDIILALEGNPTAMSLSQLHLNVPNRGAVENLPDESIIEITLEPRGADLVPVKQGKLDSYRWGVVCPLLAINELAAKAAIERDKQSFVRALHLDPLMSDYPGLPDLAEELWLINEPWAKPQR